MGSNAEIAATKLEASAKALEKSTLKTKEQMKELAQAREEGKADAIAIARTEAEVKEKKIRKPRKTLKKKRKSTEELTQKLQKDSLKCLCVPVKVTLLEEKTEQKIDSEELTFLKEKLMPQ